MTAGDNSSSQASYSEALRALERMRRIIQLYIRWWKILVIALFALGTAATLLLDQYGWSKMANAFLDITVGITFVAAMIGFVHLTVHEWRIWRWARVLDVENVGQGGLTRLLVVPNVRLNYFRLC
jgi:nicotinamide riboside transporter PnuC